MAKLKKIIKTLSALVLIVTFLSIFANSVHHVSHGGTNLGFLTKPLLYITNFPTRVKQVLKSGLKNIPPSYVKMDESFKEINNLKNDVYGLNSFYVQEKKIWETRLFNLRNDSIIHSWQLNDDTFTIEERQFANSAPLNSVLLKDRSILMFLDRTNNLYKLDKNSKILWHNTDHRFHHTLNLASDGNFWICTKDTTLVKSDEGVIRGYKDNFITKMETETGKVLFNKSISEIFIECGYANFVFGNENGVHQGGLDPLHLNDIEPILEDGKFWKKDDLLISLRHKSLILLYRPETNKIIRLLYGPFLNQHDVDIYSENEISFFNNNTSEIGIAKLNINNHEQKTLYDFDKSGILIYNFEDSTYRNLAEQQFKSEKIFTKTQGLHTIMSSGNIYVESQNSGKMYILNENEFLLKKHFRTSIEGFVEQPHWLRIYENINF